MAEERRDTPVVGGKPALDDGSALDGGPQGEAAAGAPSAPETDGAELDLELERIDTEGVLKEGFSGQEM